MAVSLGWRTSKAKWTTVLLNGTTWSLNEQRRDKTQYASYGIEPACIPACCSVLSRAAACCGSLREQIQQKGSLPGIHVAGERATRPRAEPLQEDSLQWAAAQPIWISPPVDAAAVRKAA